MTSKVDDRSSTPPPAPGPAGVAAPPAASPEDRDRFRKILDRPDSRGGCGRSDSGAGPGPDSPADLLADRFQNLVISRKPGSGEAGATPNRPDGDFAGPPDEFADQAALSGQPAGPAYQASPGGAFPIPDAGLTTASGDIDVLVRSLVSQLLVSVPDATQSEVRLTLGPDILPATTIRLLRGPDSLLRVDVTADRFDSFQTLVGAQSQLREALEKMENGAVRLTISGGYAQTGDDEGSSRRSRGQYLGEAEQSGREERPDSAGRGPGRFDPEAGT